MNKKYLLMCEILNEKGLLPTLANAAAHAEKVGPKIATALGSRAKYLEHYRSLQRLGARPRSLYFKRPQPAQAATVAA